MVTEELSPCPGRDGAHIAIKHPKYINSVTHILPTILSNNVFLVTYQIEYIFKFQMLKCFVLNSCTARRSHMSVTCYNDYRQ
jgi:hypothetical protein